jgi:hypothetical protein
LSISKRIQKKRASDAVKFSSSKGNLKSEINHIWTLKKNVGFRGLISSNYRYPSKALNIETGKIDDTCEFIVLEVSIEGEEFESD